MDSRLKKQVIAVAVVMVTAVVVMVIAANYIQGKNKSGQHVTLEESTETSQQESRQVGEYGLDPDKDPYAFLGEEDFFDPEPELQDPNITLSLLVSSVEKDMRVNVVNGNGELMKEYPFTVEVKDQQGKIHKYKDIDQDGSIYIAPVEPGEYEISLEEVEGYVLAEAGVPIMVKEQIEYTVIDDISYMIKSVDEIDEATEDTAINDAELNADGTESNKRLDNEDALFGIDVSKWNKEIDWDSVKAAGVDFAIIRCGYRGSKTGALVEDPYFQSNIEGAEAAGIKVGVYFFTQATTEVEAVEEASMVLMLCKGRKLALPVFIDTEGAGGNGRADGLDVETRTAVCEAFCRTIENSGFNSGVYASKNWFNNNLNTENLSKYTIWLAQYSKSATYEGDYDLWQYTSAGTVDGIETRVDLNLCYQNF
jgi:GH25 family lysozyme M1 (1,4-beta-N-acetylmuramidase)